VQSFLDALLSGPAAWFGVPALIGTALFLLRTIMLLAGAHHGTDFHSGGTDAVDTHGSVDHSVDHDKASSGAFKALSLQTITAFAMGFGWAGLAALNGFHKPILTSTLMAIFGGVAMVWLLALLLKAMHDLQSSGNISLESAIGREADVYLTVPPKGQGTGQVRVVIDDRMRIYNASSEADAAPTSSRVRIIKANDDNTLSVVPI
jgi:hypothetical protein